MPETKTMFSLLSPSSGRESLDRCEDRVVTATRAPAGLHVAGEVLLVQCGLVVVEMGHAQGACTRHTEINGGHRVAPLRLAVALVRTLASSIEVKGSPRTCV